MDFTNGETQRKSGKLTEQHYAGKGANLAGPGIKIATRIWVLIVIEFLVEAKLSGRFHLTRGWVEDVYAETSHVLAWDPVAENWQLVGDLTNAK